MAGSILVVPLSVDIRNKKHACHFGQDSRDYLPLIFVKSGCIWLVRIIFSSGGLAAINQNTFAFKRYQIPWKIAGKCYNTTIIGEDVLDNSNCTFAWSIFLKTHAHSHCICKTAFTFMKPSFFTSNAGSGAYNEGGVGKLTYQVLK